MQVLPHGERVTRDYAVTVFVAHQGRVALIYDDLSGELAPPSGHIRTEELPGQAAVRVVLAQTGMPVELLGEAVPDWTSPLLMRPQGLLAESITPSHEHLCLIYFARPATGARPRLSDDLTHLRWFDAAALEALPLSRQAKGWAALALAACRESH